MRIAILMVLAICLLTAASTGQTRPQSRQNVSFAVVWPKKQTSTGTTARKVAVGSTERSAVQAPSSPVPTKGKKKIVTITE